ncbi:MAG: hypothetical protein U0T36_04800 [Saprospiraceae bacterium]
MWGHWVWSIYSQSGGNSKFVQTEFGTKKLKDFLSESMQAQDGSVSTLDVKPSWVMKYQEKIKPSLCLTRD